MRLSHTARMVALFAFVCVLMHAWPTPLYAASVNVKAAKQHFVRAETHYKLGRFEEALAAYSKAYELEPRAALLFNIGQCYLELRQYDRAIFSYEAFLRDEDQATHRQLAEQRVAEAQRLQQQAITAAAATEGRERKRAEAATPAPPISEASKLTTTPAPTPTSTPTSTPAPTPKSTPIGTPTESPAAATLSPLVQPPPGDSSQSTPSWLAAPRVASSPRSRTPPLYQRWWFWAAVGGAAVATLAGSVWYASGRDSDAEGPTIPPGDLGLIDAR